MEIAVKAKFKIPELKTKLLSTKDLVLFEDSDDIFWGQKGGEGSNHLGKILMMIRDITD